MADSFKIQNVKLQVEALGGNLVAVSKMFPPASVEKVYEQGVVDFGENYVVEALEKMDSLDHLNIRWHFIGRVQRGNLNKIIDKFYLIHSLYKIDHLQKINSKTKNLQKVLVQIQHRKDDRGFGVKENELFKLIEEAKDLSQIDLGGLMFIPPTSFKGDELKNSFEWAAGLFQEIKNKLPKVGTWDTLSMGMSGDFELALAAGSTHVRMGTSIFGQRL